MSSDLNPRKWEIINIRTSLDNHSRDRVLRDAVKFMFA